MKFVRNLFMFVVLFMGLVTVAHAGAYDNTNVAQTVAANYSKLSDSDKQKLLAELSKQETAGQTAAQVAQSITPEDVEKWSNAGKAVGVAIGAMVKELGVGVAGGISSFTDTTVGKVAVGALLFKLFHDEAEHYLMCAVILFVILPLWFYSYRRTCLSYTLEEHIFFGIKTHRKRWSNTGTDNENGTHIIAAAIMFIAFIWTFLGA